MAIGTKALRRGLVRGLVVVSAFGVVSAAGAAAKTVTVGQLFPPTLIALHMTLTRRFWSPVLSSGNSYTVPKAGVITSWSFQDGATPVPALELKVGRSAGSGNYTIVAEATAGAQTANVVNTYNTHIAVKAGDLIGIYENGGNCATETLTP
ncbi:MAG: hypothetical protein JO321_13875 [Solirubrobacterales bacterium]|nr:hypothetical protein [Solirubrobacterales bacterium]